MLILSGLGARSILTLMMLPMAPVLLALSIPTTVYSRGLRLRVLNK